MLGPRNAELSSFWHIGQVVCASLDRVVRTAASRLVAVVQSWAAQANPDCNSQLSAQVALRKPSPIASGSDALRSQGCEGDGATVW